MINKTILYLTPIYPPDKGGASQYFSILAEEMGKSKDIGRIFVISSFNWMTPKRGSSGKIRIYRFIYPKSGTGSTLNKILALILNMLSSMIVFTILFYKLRKNDVVHFHSSFCSLWPKRGLKVNWPFFMFLKLLGLKGIRRIIDIRDRFSIPHIKAYEEVVDHIICASKDIYRDTKEVLLHTQKCVHIPIPLRRFDQFLDVKESGKYQKYRPYIAFVGDVVREKGIGELVKAIEILRSKGSPLSLVVVGPPIDRQLISELRSIDFVIYLGPKSPKDVANIMYASELVALPSHSEGMPRVCLEAAQLGKRLLAPPGVSEFEQACSEWTLKTVEPDEIARKIEKIISAENVCLYDLSQHEVSNFARNIHLLYFPKKI